MHYLCTSFTIPILCRATGSGKTTLAMMIKEELPHVIVINQDHYYLVSLLIASDRTNIFFLLKIQEEKLIPKSDDGCSMWDGMYTHVQCCGIV